MGRARPEGGGIVSAREEAERRYPFSPYGPYFEESRRAFIAGTEWQAAQSAAEVERLRAERDEFRRLFTECHPVHLDGVKRAEKAEAERDALAAVVESVRGWRRDNACVSLPGRWEQLDAALEPAPADVLAARDREVGARALEEAAAFLAEPYRLWMGDDGVAVAIGRDPENSTPRLRIKLVDWLAARAAALREGREDA